jgi:hypothetical protein
LVTTAQVPLCGPDVEAFDVKMHRVAFDGHAFHSQLGLRDGLFAAVTRSTIARTAPDAGDVLVRQQRLSFKARRGTRRGTARCARSASRAPAPAYSA